MNGIMSAILCKMPKLNTVINLPEASKLRFLQSSVHFLPSMKALKLSIPFIIPATFRRDILQLRVIAFAMQH
jgi:hypothetical protein